MVEDIAVPASVTANPSSILTCAQTTITLTGNSTTGGAVYSWAGPNGYSSPLRVASTMVPGPYTLAVINTSNSCSVSAAVNVVQNCP